MKVRGLKDKNLCTQLVVQQAIDIRLHQGRSALKPIKPGLSRETYTNGILHDRSRKNEVMLVCPVPPHDLKCVSGQYRRTDSHCNITEIFKINTTSRVRSSESDRQEIRKFD
jgi:hypothetical protein